jgi:NADH-quinone oxidoreductase subunit A
MLDNYVFIGIFFVAALSFPILPLIFAYLVRPKRPSEVKQSTYECGLESIGDIWVQFKVQYYLYALAFVIFDIEVVFLYPWAMALRGNEATAPLGMFGLVAMGIFLLILIFSLVYDWRKGALEWI